MRTPVPPSFVVNRIEIEDVSLFRLGPFERAIKGAECAVFRAKVRVIDVAVDDVRDDAVRVKLTADCVRFHADTNEIIGLEHFKGLCFREGHSGAAMILACQAGT
jgi:hypothetical protein